jgi:prepilin-type N-terminal cleavage/methylation domain-containing protein
MSWRRVLRRLRGERGFSLIEMLTVMVIMGIVMGSLTTVFVSASNSEADMNNRFQAQLTSRLALDKLRREVHCASVITPTGVASSVTLTLPAYCKTGSGSITWCTRNLGTNRYGLYRIVGATCSGGVKWADYLVSSGTASVCSGALCIFSYTAQSTSSLAKLHVDLPVNVRPSMSVERYELVDDIALRNSTRS